MTPPYNTGNQDFIYNDNFVDSEDDYRHSKWLSFMSKRLRIARKLLSERGVIFISIDDNEQANLKLLCDEIFGQKNYLSNFIWKKKQGGGNDSKNVVVEHEYILLYCKDNNIAQLELDKFSETKDIYPFADEKGKYGLVTLDKSSIQFSQSLVFEIVGPNNEIYLPRIVKGKQSCWRWSKKKVEEQYDELVFKNGKVYTKYYEPEGTIARSLLIDAVYGRTAKGKSELTAIFGKSIFSYPKPTPLIKYLVSLTNKNSVVLDFFAGSGTTMHAVMSLNAEDGGHRQCILVTNNENSICERVTYERNKRVIAGYTKPNGEAIKGLYDNNLRYYRTAFVGRNRSPRNLRQLVNLSTDMLCIKEDLYAEQMEFCDTKTHKGLYRYFDDGNKRMLVIYREECVPELVARIADMDFDADGRRIMVYVFSPSEDPWQGDFEPVADRVNLCSLPDAILNAYKRVLPKRKDQVVYVNPDSPNDEPQSIPNSLFPETNQEGGQA